MDDANREGRETEKVIEFDKKKRKRKGKKVVLKVHDSKINGTVGWARRKS